MKDLKKLAILLSCISLLICIIFVIQTYAKYTTSISGSSKINIARWDITVNSQAVKTGETLTGKIKPVFAGNEYIAANVIAPTAEGYFDLNIDYSQVDVSFEYTISISVRDKDNNVLGSVVDLLATRYVFNDDPLTEELFDNTQTITGNVNYENIDPLDPSTTLTKIRIYVMWNDSSDSIINAVMNNAEDTNATMAVDDSLNKVPAIFDVNVAFIQTALPPVTPPTP